MLDSSRVTARPLERDCSIKFRALFAALAATTCLTTIAHADILTRVATVPVGSEITGMFLQGGDLFFNSTDDVLIRLPTRFRTKDAGQPSRDIHTANLALLEMAFQDLETVSLPPVDEKAIGSDIDGDGVLGTARHIQQRKTYLGGGKEDPIARMPYPKGTEFLHSVRYVGISDNGQITIPHA